MMGRHGDVGYEEGELELEDGEAASVGGGGGGALGYVYGGGGGGGELDGPDAPTYIDEKIQNLLGHFRMKFEGKLTPEKLGPLWGAHGSFLPTYTRSPLAFPQYGNPAYPPNHGSASRPPYVPMETAQENHLVKTELDSRRKSDYCRISNESNGNPSQLMLNRAVNGFEQKAPKICIKVNRNKSLARSTADIYSGLGLDISPSSSSEDNLDGTAGALVPEVLPGESPNTIFEIMTCHFIPGGHLLSPLTGNVLDLIQKPRAMGRHEAPQFHNGEAELHRDWGHTSSGTLNNKDKSAMEIKSDEKRIRIPNLKSSKCRVNKLSAVNKGTKPQLQDVSDDTGSNFLPTIIKTEHSFKESAKFAGGVTDQMRGSKNDPLEGHISDKNKVIKKKPSLDHGFSCKIKCDSDEYNGQPCTSSGHLQNIPNKTTLLETEEKTVHVKEELSQDKNKETGSLFSAESMDTMAGNVDRNSSGLMTGKKKVSSSQAALFRKKLKFKAQKQLNHEIERKSYGEDGDYALDHRISLANSYPNDKSVKLEKKTISSGQTGSKSDVGNGGDLKFCTLFDNKSDPLPLVCKNGTSESSTALTAPAPIVINEQWVCCDKCENWRLLPYGMNPDVLPKKWRCSMLSWLPGMNSCKITEDETTAALRALYMVPAPENNSLDGHDNAMSGIGTYITPSFGGNIQSGRLGKLKCSHGEANVTNTLDMADMSKASKKPHARSRRKPDGVDCFPKFSEKPKPVESSEKGEIVAKDQSHPMRSIIGVDHDNLRASKKMKKESDGPLMKHHPSDFEISKSNSSANEKQKNMQKHSGISPGMRKYGLSLSGKHSHDEDIGFSDEVIKMSDTEYSALPNSSIKKRTLKQRQSSQHDLDPQHNNTETNGISNQNINESNVVKKKLRPELKLSKTDRTATHSTGTLPGVDDDRISADKECLSEQRQENIRFQHPLLSESSTRMNGCHARTSTAATSSSSKESNSHKCKADFLETRSSPVESVSSSPLRASVKNPLDQYRSYYRSYSRVAENVLSQELGKKVSSNSNINNDLGLDCDQAKAHVSGYINGGTGHHVQKDKDLLKDKQDLMNSCLIKKGSVLSIKNVKNVQSNPEDHDHKQSTGRQNGKTLPCFDSNRSDHAKLTYGNVKPDKGNIPNKDLKINPSTLKGGKQQPSLNNASKGDASYMTKKIEKAVIENLETRKQVTLNGDASNLIDASVLLKEARDLKHLSKRLKEKGDDFESTSMCFEAGLKFLHVASLWEAPIADGSKQGDSVQTMKLYSETGNLCGFCGHEFERLKKMGNAALAYKCREVAYMKAAFFKHPGVIKDTHALQAASLMVPPAESPSSSASDIDNLNNQNTVVKAVSGRGIHSPQIASNSMSGNNHHLMGLLSYTEDISNAFDGTRKSQKSFSAYLSGIGKNQVDGTALVREVLDFSFHNVNGLLQLIRHSLESINHESVK